MTRADWGKGEKGEAAAIEHVVFSASCQIRVSMPGERLRHPQYTHEHLLRERIIVHQGAFVAELLR